MKTTDILNIIDLDEVFDEVVSRRKIEVRDPFVEPYGKAEKMTASQKAAYDFYMQRKDEGARIAMIGAKGCGKTYFGAGLACILGQQFPNSVGCVISNSYQQVKDIAGKVFTDIAGKLGLEYEFFERKKIDGKPFDSFFDVRLPNGQRFYLLLRSFDAISKIEGIELDWGWAEEIQDASRDAFRVFFSRCIRGQRGNHTIFVAGMPESETHWMYSFLPQLGFVHSDEDVPDRKGIMFWPSIYENAKNLPKDTIAAMEASHTGDFKQRYILGQPSNVNSNRVFNKFFAPIHKNGRMSELLCRYDPDRKLIVVVDFNNSPLSAAVFQEKEWDDAWDDPFLVKVGDGWAKVDESGNVVKRFSSIEEFSNNTYSVLAQIDEYEMWVADGGSTRVFVEEFLNHYWREKKHVAGAVFCGDATGGRKYSSTSNSDWDIIEIMISRSGMPSVDVIRGLRQNTNIKTGVTVYSNPDVRASINLANFYLHDSKGRARVCFLPKSKYESGGLAASVSNIMYNSLGEIDKKIDRASISDRSAVRSHFADVFRYAIVYFNGGEEVYIDDFKPIIHTSSNTNGWTPSSKLEAPKINSSFSVF